MLFDVDHVPRFGDLSLFDLGPPPHLRQASDASDRP